MKYPIGFACAAALGLVLICGYGDRTDVENFILQTARIVGSSQCDVVQAMTYAQDGKISKAMNEYTNAMSQFVGATRSVDFDIKVYKDHQYGKSDENNPPSYVSAEIYSFQLERAIKSLKNAKKNTLDAPYDRLESEAENFINAMEPFLATVKKLEKYEKRKDYLDDKGEFVKSQDEQFIREADEFLRALHAFEDAYIEASAKYNASLVDQLRSSDQKREAAALEVYQAIKAFLVFFIMPDSLQNKDIQAIADERLKNIKTKLDLFSEENEKIRDDKSDKMSELEESFGKLLGDARDVKQDRYSEHAFHNMYSDYNNLVRFEMKSLKTKPGKNKNGKNERKQGQSRPGDVDIALPF